MKKHLSVSLIGVLLLTNAVTGYHYSKDIKARDNEISKLKNYVLEKDSLIAEQQSLMDTYKEENLKINKQIQSYENKVSELEKQLIDARKKVRSEP